MRTHRPCHSCHWLDHRQYPDKLMLGNLHARAGHPPSYKWHDQNVRCDRIRQKTSKSVHSFPYDNEKEHFQCLTRGRRVSPALSFKWPKNVFLVLPPVYGSTSKIRFLVFRAGHATFQSSYKLHMKRDSSWPFEDFPRGRELFNILWKKMDNKAVIIRSRTKNTYVCYCVIQCDRKLSVRNDYWESDHEISRGMKTWRKLIVRTRNKIKIPTE